MSVQEHGMGSVNIPSGNPARNPVEGYSPFLQRSVSTANPAAPTSPEPRLIHDLSQTLSSLYQQAFGAHDSQQAHLQTESFNDQALVFSSSDNRLAAQAADDFLSRFAPSA